MWLLLCSVVRLSLCWSLFGWLTCWVDEVFWGWRHSLFSGLTFACGCFCSEVGLFFGFTVSFCWVSLVVD